LRKKTAVKGEKGTQDTVVKDPGGAKDKVLKKKLKGTALKANFEEH